MARRRLAQAIGPVVAGIVLVTSACGSDEDAAGDDGSADSDPTSAPSSTSPTPSTPTTSPTPTGQPSPTDPTTETPTEEPMPRNDPVAEAIADLANSTGADPEDIQVVAHDQVTWRDGSLGCPEPGKMYTQALVNGYRIVLRVAGQDVHYHGSAGGSPFRCDSPNPNGAID